MRKGGAAARQMLIQAAANEWNVPAGRMQRRQRRDHSLPSGRTTTYGKVADAAAKLEAPKDVQLKDPKDWTIAGKPVKRLDTAEKLNGKQIYSIDVKLPGMLNAAIKACPVFGGKLKSFDAAAGPRHAGGQEGRSRRRHCALRSSPTLGGGPRRRSMPFRSNGTRGRTPRSPATASRRCSRRD